MTSTADWRAARAALEGGRWEVAATLFSALAEATGDPEAHEGLAQAAWWLDDADTTLGAREAAYRGFRTTGRDLGAAGAAASLGYDSMLFGHGVAVGRGWLSRAADLLDGSAASREAGWLEVRRAEVALNVDHDAAAAAAHARRAQEIAATVSDEDLLIVGRALLGLSRVRLGEVAEGMGPLEAAAAAATAGDVSDLMWLGKICCWLISACQETHDMAGAEDWCARVTEICERRDLAPLFAVCQTQYAGVLLASGHAEEAESALEGVVARLRRSRRVSRLQAVAALGELRRRQGRTGEAEDLLRQAGDAPAAMASLARLHLDTGEPERALALAAQLLRSLPAGQVLERVDAIAVAVAAHAATGDLGSARACADELRSIARRIATPALTGRADVAQALVAEAGAAAGEGDAGAALPSWQDAVRHFRLAGLAFDEADTRLRLAAALRRGGQEDAAAEHEAAARSVLDTLRTRPAAADPGGRLTDRQVEVVALVARGLSNQDIAAHLHLSEHTVHRHVANIYTALGVGSRAAAAAYATMHGLGGSDPA